jgi:acyl carrier protein
MTDPRERLQELFRQIFNDPTLELRDEWTAADVDGWDSLRHTDLIIAIEKAFSIRFAIAEMSRTREPGSNVGTLLELIRNKVAARR